MNNEERKIAVEEACDFAYGRLQGEMFTEEQIFKNGFYACLGWLITKPFPQLLELVKDKDIAKDERLQATVLEELVAVYGINRSLGNILDNIKTVLKCREKTS